MGCFGSKGVYKRQENGELVCRWCGDPRREPASACPSAAAAAAAAQTQSPVAPHTPIAAIKHASKNRLTAFVIDRKSASEKERQREAMPRFQTTRMQSDFDEEEEGEAASEEETAAVGSPSPAPSRPPDPAEEAAPEYEFHQRVEAVHTEVITAASSTYFTEMLREVVEESVSAN